MSKRARFLLGATVATFVMGVGIAGLIVEELMGKLPPKPPRPQPRTWQQDAWSFWEEQLKA